MFAVPFSLAKPDAISPIGVFPGEFGEAFASPAEAKDFSSLLKGFVQLAKLPGGEDAKAAMPAEAAVVPALPTDGAATPAGEPANPAPDCKVANCPGKILPPALPQAEGVTLVAPATVAPVARQVARGDNAAKAVAPDAEAPETEAPKSEAPSLEAPEPVAPEPVAPIIAPVTIAQPVQAISPTPPPAPGPAVPVTEAPATPATPATLATSPTPAATDSSARPVEHRADRKEPASPPILPVADKARPVESAIAQPIAVSADARPVQPAPSTMVPVSGSAIAQAAERIAHQDSQDTPAERSPQQGAPQAAPLGHSAQTAPAAADLPQPEFASDLPQQLQSASPLSAGPAAPQPARPDELVALVDRLAAARAALSPLEASLEVEHPDFGAVGLNFRQDRLGGLTVDVTTADAELGQSVAVMAARAGAESGTGTQPEYHSQPQARGTGPDRDAAETAQRGDQGRRASADDHPQRTGQADGHADATESKPRAAPRGTFA